MDKFTKLSNPQYQERIMAEFFDTSKLVLMCRQHMYAGGGVIPEQGQHCAECHLAFWQVLAASFPPEKREQMIAELHETAFKLAEEVEAGRFDIKLFPHAQIESVEKGKD